MKDYEKQHIKNIASYGRAVKKAYREAIDQVVNISYKLSLNANDEFYFRNYPIVLKKVNKILKELNTQVYGVTSEGINSEWDLAVEKNNNLAQLIYGKGLNQLPDDIKDLYLSNNDKARKAFLYRKYNGLGLSEKIWKNTTQLKTELELALEVGIGKGQSAANMTKTVKQYLNDPDKLFRRVRSKEDGILRLSKAAKSYNPGRGKYRSSYKNAHRLTANETNFSYEASQKEKRSQQDFIVGIEIKVSPRHKASDDKGGISCLSLQGKYPKDFDFTNKWHVNCRCQSYNILKTDSELDKDLDLLLEDKQPTTNSENKVSTKPKNYTNYVKENEKKWENWVNPPRFIVNN